MSYKPYPAYKDSGVEWLGEIPKGWDKIRLRFLVKLNPSKNELGADHPTEISFLPMDNVGDDGTLRLDTIRKWSEVESGYSYFSEGDISYAIITPCFENGKGAQMVGLYNGCGFGTTELCILRPQKSCNGRWLWFLTISEPFRKIGESYMYGAGGQKRVREISQ
jgi:type I restriction enzyme S subunit